MHLANIRQWQWMILSVIVGALIGYVRQEAASDLAGQYGECINGQQHFEQALIAVEQGRPRFTDISVHSRGVPDGRGGTKRVHVVSGLYFNGQYSQEGGRLIARWQPAFYLASIPYKPATNLAAIGKPQLAQKFQAIARPTVMDYLEVLSESANVHYTYAWWQGMGLWQCTVASFVFVGVLWPIVVNLLVYGSWRRPREEPGIDLSKVDAHANASKKQEVTDDDRQQLEAIEAELESQLDPTPAPAPAGKSSPTPIRQLETSPLAPAATTADAVREFGAKPDDYYPTERKQRR